MIPAGNVTAPENLFTEGGWHFPLGEQIKGTAEELGQDPTTWLFGFAFLLAIMAFIGVYALTHRAKMGQKGSLFLACIAAEGILVYFYRTETVPGLVLIPFGLIAVLLVVWRKSPAPID